MCNRTARILAALAPEVRAEVERRIAASPRGRLSVRQALLTMGIDTFTKKCYTGASPVPAAVTAAPKDYIKPKSTGITVSDTSSVPVNSRSQCSKTRPDAGAREVGERPWFQPGPPLSPFEPIPVTLFPEEVLAALAPPPEQSKEGPPDKGSPVRPPSRPSVPEGFEFPEAAEALVAEWVAQAAKRRARGVVSAGWERTQRTALERLYARFPAYFCGALRVIIERDIESVNYAAKVAEGRARRGEPPDNVFVFMPRRATAEEVGRMSNREYEQYSRARAQALAREKAAAERKLLNEFAQRAAQRSAHAR